MIGQSGVPGPVVVPLDGSPFAEVAVPMGRLLSTTTGAALHFVHVMTSPLPSPSHPEELIQLEERLRNRTLIYLRGVTRVSQAPPTTETAVLRGDAGVADALTAYGSETRASWIVLTTHGAGGLSRWLRGSVAASLAQRANTPLLFLRPWDHTGDLVAGERRLRAILVPLDGSEESEAALDPAISLARGFASTLVLARVVPSALAKGRGSGSVDGPIRDPEAIAYLESHADSLRSLRLAAETLPVANDDPAQGIILAASERGCDLICMATHGLGGLQRTLLGSVADRVLTESAAPLALVRPRGA